MRARGRATKINTKNVMQRVPFKSTKLKKAKEKKGTIFLHTQTHTLIQQNCTRFPCCCCCDEAEAY